MNKQRKLWAGNVILQVKLAFDPQKRTRMQTPKRFASSIIAAITLLSTFSSAAPKSIDPCQIIKPEDVTRLIAAGLQQKASQEPLSDGTIKYNCTYFPKGFNLEGENSPNMFLGLSISVCANRAAAQKGWNKTLEFLPLLEGGFEGGKFKPITGLGDTAKAIEGTKPKQKPALKMAMLIALKGNVFYQVMAWKPKQNPLETTKTVAKLVFSSLP